MSAGVELDAFVDRLLRTGRRCFIVTRDHDEIVGLITPEEVRRVIGVVGQKSQSATPCVRYRPSEPWPAKPVTDALKIMSGDDVNQLPVVADGNLAGVVTRSHVLRLIQTHAELNL